MSRPNAANDRFPGRSLERLASFPCASRRRSLAAWLVVAGLALPLLAGCGGADGDEGDEGGAVDSAAVDAAADSTGASDSTSAPQKKEKAIKVNVAPVRRGDLVLPVFADGVIRTPRSVEVRTRVAGALSEVRVEDGDRVRRGQLLARVDPREYALALEESRSRHFQALSQIAAEADTLTPNGSALAGFEERKTALEQERRQGSLDREEYRTQLLELEIEALKNGAFRQEVLEQRTGLAEARVAEERARIDLDHTEIRAPFAGIVQGLTVVPGEIVSVNSPICFLYDNERLEAVVNVLETDLGNLEEGRPALLAVPATGDTLRTAVDVISPSLDEASRTCEVVIRFDNPDGRFRPGMFARAEIAGWVHADRLAVRREAVLLRDNRPLVFKVVEDFAQWLYVDTGLENNDWIEILAVHSGGSLDPGDRVVVSDHLTLAHEAKIQVRKTLPEERRWAFGGEGEVAAAGSPR